MRATQNAPPLSAIIDAIDTHTKTVRVCNFTGTDAERAAIVDHKQPHSVEVSFAETADRPADTVKLRWQGHVQATSPVEEVLEYVPAWEESMSSELSIEPPAVLARLDDTFFESVDKCRMVMASRIVEFRAWNVGSGVLHAGFQDLAKLDHQRSTYRNLADSGVEVHVHGAPAPETTADLDLAVHEGTGEEVACHWWVAFDGAGDDEDTALLLAAEREPDRFHGFWTYDVTVTHEVIARCEALAADATRSRSASTV